MKRGSFAIFVILLFLISPIAASADLVDFFSGDYITGELFNNALTGMAVGDPGYCETDEGLNDYGNCPTEFCAANPSEDLCVAAAAAAGQDGRGAGTDGATGAGGESGSGQSTAGDGGAASSAGKPAGGSDVQPRPGEAGYCATLMGQEDFTYCPSEFCGFNPGASECVTQGGGASAPPTTQPPASLTPDDLGGVVITDARFEAGRGVIVVFQDSVNAGKLTGAVITGRVVANRITGFGVWDSIKGFFKKLFGLGARGVRVGELQRVYYAVFRGVNQVGWVGSDECQNAGGVLTCTYVDAVQQGEVDVTYSYSIRSCLSRDVSQCSSKGPQTRSVAVAKKPAAAGVEQNSPSVTYDLAMVKRADYNDDKKIDNEDYYGGNNPDAKWFSKEGVYGTLASDINNDGKYGDATDNAIITKMLEQKVTLVYTAEQVKKADFNKDNKITGDDYSDFIAAIGSAAADVSGDGSNGNEADFVLISKMVEDNAGVAGVAPKLGEQQTCTPTKAALTGEALVKNADQAVPKGVIDNDDLFKVSELSFDVDGDGCFDAARDKAAFQSVFGRTYTIAVACVPKTALSGDALLKNADLAAPKGVIDNDDYFAFAVVYGTAQAIDVNGDGCKDSKDSDALTASIGKTYNVAAPTGPSVLKADVSATVLTGVVGQQVILDGSKSTGKQADGKPLGYTWDQVLTPAPPEVVAIKDVVKAQASFTPKKAGDYSFRLIVTDADRTTNTATVTIKVSAGGAGACTPTKPVLSGEALIKNADQAVPKGVIDNDDLQKVSELSFDVDGDGCFDAAKDGAAFTSVFGKTYTVQPPSVGINVAGSKLSSRLGYEGAAVKVKLSWEAVKLQEGGNLVSAAVVYGNEISSYSVLDTIGDFFRRLFGGEARGARLTTGGGGVIEKAVYYRIERTPVFTDAQLTDKRFIVRSETQAGCEDTACEYVDAAVNVGTEYTYKIKACLDAEGKAQCTATPFGETKIKPVLPDFDGNGCVDVCDVGVLAKAFNTRVGGSGYDARADVEVEGVSKDTIDIQDFFVLAGLNGKQAACSAVKGLPDLNDIINKNPGDDANGNPKWVKIVAEHPACKKAAEGGVPGQPAYDASCSNPVIIKEKGKRINEGGSKGSGKLACESTANKFCVKIQQWYGASTVWKDVAPGEVGGELPCEVTSGVNYDGAYVACCSATANKAPTVSVTKQLTGAVGGKVTLDGSGSSDPESGKTGLTYLWEQVSTPPNTNTFVPEKVTLTGGNTAQASFTPGKEGVYTFKLTVTDDKGASASDTITVNVGGLPDFDANGCVDYCDFVTFSRAFDKTKGQAGFQALADLQKDDKIDFDDFFQFANIYGLQGAACGSGAVLPAASTLDVTKAKTDVSCDLKQIITAGNKLEVTIGTDKLATFKWKKIATKTRDIALEDGVFYTLSWKEPGQQQEQIKIVPPKTPTAEGYTCANGVCQFKQAGKSFEGTYQYKYILKACLDKEGKDCTVELASVELTSTGELAPDRVEAVHEVPANVYSGDDFVLTAKIKSGLPYVKEVSLYSLPQSGYELYRRNPDSYSYQLRDQGTSLVKDATGNFNYTLGRGGSNQDTIYYYFVITRTDGKPAPVLGSETNPYILNVLADAPGDYDRKFDIVLDGCVDKADESAYAALLLPTQTDESKKVDLDGDGKKDDKDKKFFERYLRKHSIKIATDKLCKCKEADKCLDLAGDACLNPNQASADNKNVCSVGKKAKGCSAGDDYEITIAGSSYCCGVGVWTAGKCTAAPNPAAKLVKQEQGLKGVAGKNKLRFDRTGFEIELGLKAGSEGGVTTLLYSKDATVAEKTPAETGVTKKAMKYVQVLTEDDRLEKGDTALLDEVKITFTYTDGEIAALGLSEPSLQIYWFNTATKKWDALASKADAASNTVNATLNHLSIFGLFGDQTSVPATTPTTQPPVQPTGGQTGGPGGGGAGGGGARGGAGGFVAMQKGSQCVRVSVGDQKFFEAQGYVKVAACAAAPTATVPATVKPGTGGTLPRPTLPPLPGVRPTLPVAGEDSDNDGLVDSWEMNFFGSLQQGIEDDYDGDGFANGEEFALNADPTDASSPGGKAGGWIWIVLGVAVIGGLVFLMIWLKRRGRKRIAEAPGKEKKQEDDFLSLIKKAEGKAEGKKEEKRDEKGGKEESEINPKIMDYVEKARKAGYDAETIKNNLLQVGWDRKQIEAALKK